MRSFAKIKPSRKFPNLQYVDVHDLVNYNMVYMDENRLTKKIFNYNYSMPGGKSWSSDMKTILTKVDILTNFYDKAPVDLKILTISSGQLVK